MDQHHSKAKKYCTNCGSPLAFKMVLVAVNPLKISCQSCKIPIKVNIMHGIIAVMIVLLLAVILFYGLRKMGLAYGPVFFALIVLGILVEYAYFKALQKGIISSTLINDNAK